MLIKEFRYPLPLSLSECERGVPYTVSEASRRETVNGEGVEIVESRPAEHPDLGACLHSTKIIRLSNRLPVLLRAILPSIELHEETWFQFPRARTVLKSNYLKDNFTITLDTLMVDGDRGQQENVLGLSQEELKKREVDLVDLAKDSLDPKDYTTAEDPLLVRSERLQRGPLSEEWLAKADPVSCSYKLAKVEFKWFGLQSRVESLIISILRNLFFKFHRQLFCWADVWMSMTPEEIHRFEKQVQAELAPKSKSKTVSTEQQPSLTTPASDRTTTRTS